MGLYTNQGIQPTIQPELSLVMSTPSEAPGHPKCLLPRIPPPPMRAHLLHILHFEHWFQLVSVQVHTHPECHVHSSRLLPITTEMTLAKCRNNKILETGKCNSMKHDSLFQVISRTSKIILSPLQVGFHIPHAPDILSYRWSMDAVHPVAGAQKRSWGRSYPVHTLDSSKNI